jgi:hypothetical protein
MFSQILDLADKLDIIQTVKAKLCASPIPPRTSWSPSSVNYRRSRTATDDGAA